jgi:hypothetical protein
VVPHVDAINSFELKSFIDECFKVPTDHKMLPGYRRIVGRIYHDISDAGDAMSNATLVQLVTTAITNVDQVLKPEWHHLFANYLDVHSKYSDGDDEWWTDHFDKKAFQRLLIVFPAQNGLGGKAAGIPVC